jgi:hypothetical protein
MPIVLRDEASSMYRTDREETDAAIRICQTKAMVYLKHAPARPLRRGIPGTPYFIEISPTLITVKVQGSRRAGVSLPLIEVIRRLSTPETVPAKFHGDPMAYLEWVTKRKKKRR